MADSNFGVFSVAQATRHYGVCALLRLTASRARALAQRKLPPGADIALHWSPSSQDQLDPAMDSAPIAGRLLYVRLTADGFRPVDLYLFTTLLDASRYPLAELVTLYSKRWRVELNLREVKATLDMELLAAKTVDMVRKELYAGLLAYNIIRAFMALAADKAGLSPLALSFSKCWRRISQALLSLRYMDTAAHIAQLLQRLLRQLAACRLAQRPRFRIEPRAVRGRPVVYPTFKGSRAEARQRVIEQRMLEQQREAMKS